MKALKITLTHGRIWTAETSDGKRSSASTLEGALDKMLPLPPKEAYLGPWGGVAVVFDGIRDSGGDGQFQQGRAGA